jgi:ADP-ribose pyrophosphatase YjhB (NUDIX family)
MAEPLSQAAALPIRDGLVCLVTSRGGRRWVIPKGHIETGHTPEEAASTEAFEEAGLIGVMNPVSVGTYHYEKFRRSHAVSVFIMTVTEEKANWPERRERTREWVTFETAIARLAEPELRAIVQAVAAMAANDAFEIIPRQVMAE